MRKISNTQSFFFSKNFVFFIFSSFFPKADVIILQTAHDDDDVIDVVVLIFNDQQDNCQHLRTRETYKDTQRTDHMLTIYTTEQIARHTRAGYAS